MTAQRGDRDFQWRNGVEGLAEGELHRAAHLSEGRAFEHTVTGGENAAEGADIEKFAAQPIFGELGLLVFGTLGQCSGGGYFTFDLLSLDDGTLLDEDVVAVGGGALSSGREKIEEVADFALEADVGDEAAIGVGVETRHIAGIGVAVGVAIGDFEEEEKIVTVGEDVGAHGWMGWVG